MADHDLVEPRMAVLRDKLPGLTTPDERLLLIARALAVGCPDGYCGRVGHCGTCYIACELGLFELLRDAQSDAMKEVLQGG